MANVAKRHRTKRMTTAGVVAWLAASAPTSAVKPTKRYRRLSGNEGQSGSDYFTVK